MIKKIIRFLLETETGKIVLQSLVDLVMKAIKKKVSDLPFGTRLDIQKSLDLVHASLHKDPINVSDLI